MAKSLGLILGLMLVTLISAPAQAVTSYWPGFWTGITGDGATISFRARGNRMRKMRIGLPFSCTDKETSENYMYYYSWTSSYLPVCPLPANGRITEHRLRTDDPAWPGTLVVANLRLNQKRGRVRIVYLYESELQTCTGVREFRLKWSPVP